MAEVPSPPPMRPSVFQVTEAEHFVPWRLGRGDFLLGVRRLVGVVRKVPIVAASARRNAPIMLTQGRTREFVETIEVSDADVLIQLGGHVGPGLRAAIDVAWPHLAPGLREDLVEQFAQNAHLASRTVRVADDLNWRYVGAAMPGYQPTLESFLPDARRRVVWREEP